MELIKQICVNIYNWLTRPLFISDVPYYHIKRIPKSKKKSR